MAVRLFVGNLPFTVTEADLREHFAAVGPVAGVWLATDRETGRPRGFAFVEYEDRAHAEEAIRRFNNQPLGGRNLAVNEARPQERSSGPAPYRPGGSSYSARPPRPDSGGSPGGFDRPRPMSGPRPGGFVSDMPPDDAGGRSRDRSRNFGPDAPARRKRKGDRKNFDGGPKKPLPITSGGRFYSGEDDDESDDLSDLDAMFEVDDDLDGELDDETDAEGDDGESAETPGDAADTSDGTPDDEPR